MARRIGQLPSIKRGKGRERFPWDEWLDGSTWELTAGEDFTDRTPSEFRNTAWAAARRRGKKVATRVESATTLVIQAYEAHTRRTEGS